MHLLFVTEILPTWLRPFKNPQGSSVQEQTVYRTFDGSLQHEVYHMWRIYLQGEEV